MQTSKEPYQLYGFYGAFLGTLVNPLEHPNKNKNFKIPSTT